MQFVEGALDPFHRGNGNGSRSDTEDWLDEQSIFDNEWGSSAATTFNPGGTDAYGHELSEERREKFESLYKLHNGKMESSRKSDIRTSYVENDAKMFMSVLEMPDTQRERVLLILNDLDISSNNFGSRRYEKIILALCTLVSDEALTDRPNPSIENRLFLRDEFRDLMDCTGTSSSELRKIRRDIRQKSEHF